MAISVRVDHPFQRLAKFMATGYVKVLKNGIRIWSCIEHVAGPFSSLLSQSDVYRRQRERSGFHDAAAGIADEHSHLPEEAPVDQGAEVHPYPPALILH